MKDESLEAKDIHPSAFILALLRDGVTGNTSGFELEDEGSTPSPAAISFPEIRKRYFDCPQGISESVR